MPAVEIIANAHRSPMKISAVLLAGGESRRMGEDKATLLFRGRPLWKVQIELLRKLQPAEVFVSARTDPAWRPNEFTFVPDDPPSRGPLSGLAAASARMRTKHLLVLAVDMPFMTETHLRFLHDQIGPGRGLLPKIDNRAEPLAAIYPIEARVDFVAALAGNDFSLQTLTRKLVDAGRLFEFRVTEEDAALYRGLNEPADVIDCLPIR
jgi:molybdopterin-guanine dinucleotide biosynthesis protein A